MMSSLKKIVVVVVVVEPSGEQPDEPCVVLPDTCLCLEYLWWRMAGTLKRSLTNPCELLLHETHSIFDGTQFLQVKPMWCWMVCRMSGMNLL